jgi:hypothetical protein
VIALLAIVAAAVLSVRYYRAHRAQHGEHDSRASEYYIHDKGRCLAKGVHVGQFLRLVSHTTTVLEHVVSMSLFVHSMVIHPVLQVSLNNSKLTHFLLPHPAGGGSGMPVWNPAFMVGAEVTWWQQPSLAGARRHACLL